MNNLKDNILLNALQALSTIALNFSLRMVNVKEAINNLITYLKDNIYDYVELIDWQKELLEWEGVKNFNQLPLPKKLVYLYFINHWKHTPDKNDLLIQLVSAIDYKDIAGLEIDKATFESTSPLDKVKLLRRQLHFLNESIDLYDLDEATINTWIGLGLLNILGQ